MKEDGGDANAKCGCIGIGSFDDAVSSLELVVQGYRTDSSRTYRFLVQGCRKPRRRLQGGGQVGVYVDVNDRR